MRSESLEKKFLSKILVEKMRKGSVSLKKCINFLTPFPKENEKVINSLLENREIVKTGDLIDVTDKGRKRVKVVMCGGTFDILHPGHLLTLKNAKKLGDILVVVIAKDETVKKFRKKQPHNKEQKRLELVSALRFVDLALLGGKGSIYDTLLKIIPDIVVLGYDQIHNENEIREYAKTHKMRIKVVRLTKRMEGVKSSTLLKDESLIYEI
ncbi:MAG: adenylyltransferase/cytidyltransferase family protein [Nitrososphaeria archaeon]